VLAAVCERPPSLEVAPTHLQTAAAKAAGQEARAPRSRTAIAMRRTPRRTKNLELFDDPVSLKLVQTVVK
jgi:hypothetical protein